ncbi:MAG: FG-GAP repeat domain-containing protein [Candidatus Hodarchaeota archaeon]
MDRQTQNVANNVKITLIVTVITLLVLSTLGCFEEKNLELTLGEYWFGNGGMAVRSVAMGDVDGDSDPELISVGCLNECYMKGNKTVYSSSSPNGLLRIWHWTGDTLDLAHSEEWGYWGTRHSAQVYSVAVGDVDGDGGPELITGGWSHIGTGYLNGQLRIWHWIRGDLHLASSEEWITVSDTEVRSVAVGDVDSDGSLEIVTGGRARNGPHIYAQLRIWYWTGNTLDLAHSEEWLMDDFTSVTAIAVGDGDGDGSLELITGGYIIDGIHLKGQLRIWHWTGTTLHLEQSEEWATGGDTMVRSVTVGDGDGDGDLELITGGWVHVGKQVKGQLRIWHWTGSTLTLEQSEEWTTGNDTAVWSVGVGDADGDGSPEFITGGFAHIDPHLNGQLRIWHWTGDALNLEWSEEWTTGGETAVWSVGLADINSKGGPELITGGFVGTVDVLDYKIIGELPPGTTPLKSQLRIWHWTGTILNLEQNVEWFS